MIFNSAGHSDKDPGAVANGYKEAELAKEFRNLINVNLDKLKAKYKNDLDSESLGQYLGRIQPGTGSVVYETHFNAATPQATGVEVVIPDRHTNYEYEAAKEIASVIACATGLTLRGKKKNGVITESETARGKLGIMREEGINLLSEICFITNKSDLERFFQAKHVIAARIADILKKYDDLLP